MHACRVQKQIRRTAGPRNALMRIGCKKKRVFFRNHMIMPGRRIRIPVYFSIIDSEWNKVKREFGKKSWQKPIDVAACKYYCLPIPTFFTTPIFAPRNRSPISVKLCGDVAHKKIAGSVSPYSRSSSDAHPAHSPLPAPLLRRNR